MQSRRWNINRIYNTGARERLKPVEGHRKLAVIGFGGDEELAGLRRMARRNKEVIIRWSVVEQRGQPESGA